MPSMKDESNQLIKLCLLDHCLSSPSIHACLIQNYNALKYLTKGDFIKSHTMKQLTTFVAKMMPNEQEHEQIYGEYINIGAGDQRSWAFDEEYSARLSRDDHMGSH